MSLAPTTRERTGTSANVIIPVRWDHSEVTSRMPATGSRTAAGFTPSVRTEAKVWSAAVPATERPITATTVSATVATCIQKPARVSTILRSSTATRRPRPGRVWTPAVLTGIGGARVVVLMRGLLPARGDRIGRGQLEEEALEAGVRGGGDPVQHDAARPSPPGDDLRLGLDQPAAAVGGVRRQAGAVQGGVEPREVGGLDDRPGLGQQLGARALRLDPPVADDHDPVGDGLDLGQQVRGEQHGAAAVGEAPQQPAHPAHALGIEAVGGLVEDQDLRVAEQRVGEAEALAHAERVLADAPAGRRLVEADELEQLVDALHRHAHGPGGDGERLAAAAAGVLRRRVEQDPDAAAGVRQVAVAPAEDPGLAAVGLGQADEHPHRRALAGAVGAEEAGDGARLAAEGDIGDDGAPSELLGESVRFRSCRQTRGRPGFRPRSRGLRLPAPCGGGEQRLW